MRIPITRPYLSDEEWGAVRPVLQSGWVSLGPKTVEFEKRFADYHQVAHALATTSCTTALHLGLATLGVGPGDEVIVPSFTFIASANAVVYTGARPVLVDIDLRTFNIDPAAFEAAITPRTKAVMPVHLFGLCADMDAVVAIAKSHGLTMVEDAACAIGSTIRDKFAGTFGEFGAFSTHARKIITCGEGGVLTTDDDALTKKAWALRSHAGAVSDVERHEKGEFALPEFDDVGFNYRMTDIQAAILIAQMNKLDDILARRRAAAARYDRELSDLAEFLTTPFVPEGYGHTYQSYVMMVRSGSPLTRDQLALRLIKDGISVRQGTHAVHLQRVYRERDGYREEDFPKSTAADRNSLTLPLFPSMTEEEQSYVIERVHEIFRSPQA